MFFDSYLEGNLGKYRYGMIMEETKRIVERINSA
jgi:hypothetical protein